MGSGRHVAHRQQPGARSGVPQGGARQREAEQSTLLLLHTGADEDIRDARAAAFAHGHTVLRLARRVQRQLLPKLRHHWTSASGSLQRCHRAPRSAAHHRPLPLLRQTPAQRALLPDTHTLLRALLQQHSQKRLRTTRRTYAEHHAWMECVVRLQIGAPRRRQLVALCQRPFPRRHNQLLLA